MIPFHRLLISTAILFCAGFAAYSGLQYKDTPSFISLAAAVAFAIAAIALTYYLRHLNRFLGR